MGEGDFSQEQGARRECIEIHDSTRNAAIGKKRRAFCPSATIGSLFLKTLKITGWRRSDAFGLFLAMLLGALVGWASAGLGGFVGCLLGFHFTGAFAPVLAWRLLTGFGSLSLGVVVKAA